MLEPEKRHQAMLLEACVANILPIFGTVRQLPHRDANLDIATDVYGRNKESGRVATSFHPQTLVVVKVPAK